MGRKGTSKRQVAWLRDTKRSFIVKQAALELKPSFLVVSFANELNLFLET